MTFFCYILSYRNLYDRIASEILSILTNKKSEGINHVRYKSEKY